MRRAVVGFGGRYLDERSKNNAGGSRERSNEVCILEESTAKSLSVSSYSKGNFRTKTSDKNVYQFAKGPNRSASRENSYF